MGVLCPPGCDRVNLPAKIWGCHGTPRYDTPGVSTSDSEAKSINNATSSEDFSKIQRKYIKNSCCIRERFLLTSFQKFEDIFFSFVSLASYHRKYFYRKYWIFMFHSILRLFSALERNLIWKKVFDDVTHLKKVFLAL